ncbi:Nuclear pore glycoprotein p62 [Galdieria sulphuraria]|nr:Nuclear pore glycoprotein p62 [Galdieria sulphuraria]
MSFSGSTSTGISFNFAPQTNTKPSFGTAVNPFSTATSGSTSAPPSFGTGSVFTGLTSSSSFGSSSSLGSVGAIAQSLAASSSSLFGSSFTKSGASGSSLFSAPSNLASVSSSANSSSFSFAPFSQQPTSTPANSGASLFSFSSSSGSTVNVGTTTALTAPSLQSSSASFQTSPFSFSTSVPNLSVNSTSFASPSASSSGTLTSGFSSSVSTFSLPFTTASTQVTTSLSTAAPSSSTSLPAPSLFTTNQSSASILGSSTTNILSTATAPSSSFTFSGFSKEPSSNVVTGASASGGAIPSFSSTGFVLNTGANTQATLNTSSSNVTSTSEPVSEVKDLNLNEIINSWNDKVEELVDRFRRQAAIVNRWDRFLYQNERRIESLYTEAQGVHSAHKELEMNLDTALAQQKELDGYLQALENQLEKYFVSMGEMGSTSADYEREEMYRTATKMASELDTIGNSLREVVSDIHQLNKPAEDDVVGQIVAILDAHLKSLEYLDETCTQLGKRTQELSLLSDRVEKDTQRLLQSSHMRR